MSGLISLSGREGYFFAIRGCKFSSIEQTRVVQLVRPKVQVRKLSRISTNLKSAVRSLVKVRQISKSSSSFTACVCLNCKGQQPPPVQSHSFLAVKVTCLMI